jgi:hypothetical protein
MRRRKAAQLFLVNALALTAKLVRRLRPRSHGTAFVPERDEA